MRSFSIDRRPDYEQFLKVLWRRERPDHLPFYEHLASGGFIARRLGVTEDVLTWDNPDFPKLYTDFWIGMGFDCVPLEIPPRLTLAKIQNRGESYESEATACIFNQDDFERYAWPDVSDPIDFSYFERLARHLPEGAKIVGGVCGGPFEWATGMMGYQGLSLAQVTDPDLFRALFEKIGALHASAVDQLSDFEDVVALRQGDDLGFKTATFLSPDILREHVLPIYTRMAAHAHDRGKPFILHSCGNLEGVYDDLIETCRIDAKHSFENTILPVEKFKARYGDRITPLGGLDVDFICTEGEEAIRAYARRVIEACYADGFYALGTGNSLTNYMPVENYLIALDEAVRVTGS